MYLLAHFQHNNQHTEAENADRDKAYAVLDAIGAGMAVLIYTIIIIYLTYQYCKISKKVKIA